MSGSPLRMFSGSSQTAPTDGPSPTSPSRPFPIGPSGSPSISSSPAESGGGGLPSSTGLRKQVHLPPHGLSDFVIHFRDTDYHSHTFLLHTHSTYFRAFLSAPQARVEVERAEVVSEGSKRRRVTHFTSSSSEEAGSKCSHSSLTRCIDLPDDFGIKRADESQFLLFLRHLYFASTLHLPPFEPKEAIIASLTDDTRTCLDFPSNPTATEARVNSYAQPSARGVPLARLELLSLFEYFDCQQAMEQCWAVIASVVEDDVSAAWFWLPTAIEYGMKDIEESCIEEVGTDENVTLEREFYEANLALLTAPTLVRVVEALSKNLKNALEALKARK
jgi:hypothetical protein